MIGVVWAVELDDVTLTVWQRWRVWLAGTK
jgi:hypothetical protein